MSATERAVLDYITEVAAEAGDTRAVVADTNLMEAGVLDSLGLVRLIQFLEAKFGIAITDADVSADVFASPASIAAYVESRK